MKTKYQEALDRQKQNVKKLREKEFVEYTADFKTLQELVDKETPMKPIINKNLDWSCPRCDGYHTKFVKYYCEYCGQKLDWSDSNA